MLNDKTARQKAVFAGLEKSPCLLGNALLNDGDPVDDAIITTACVHSIAISLRRIADKLDDFYEHGVNVNQA